VLLKSGHQLRIIIDKIFAGLGYVPDIILETDNWETCLRMVEAGIAFTILPNARSDVDDKHIRAYCLKGDYYQQTFLCYRKNVYFSKVMIEFTRIASSVFSENNAGVHQSDTIMLG
jgi:DNA-binding transcriptional LysR family regulator